MKRVLFIAGGLCWFLFASCFCVFVVRYLTHGAGLQIFGWSLSAGSVLLGVVQVTGLVLGAVICFTIGALLFVRGIAPPEKGKEKTESV